ncbi:GAF domain-containing protein [candidate division KSB1 bacterium]|nr:GAF domain-containing protein [candidate division KSB1 bacterium]
MKQRKIISHIITFCLALIFFFGFQYALTQLLTDKRLADLLSISLVMLLYNPIQSLIFSNLNRVINKKQVFLQIQFQQLMEEVQYITHLLRLQRVLVHRISELLRLQVVSLFTFNEASNIYELSDGLGITQKDKRKIQFKPSGGLLVWLRIEKNALYFPKLTGNKRYQYLGKEEKEKIKKLQATLCVPLVLGDKIIGILFLGPKPTKQGFTELEIEMLQQIANQSAQAIVNATAQRDLTNRDRELVRFQNRVRTLENRLSENQKAHQNLLDYLKTGLVVMKLGNRIVKLNEDFKEAMLPDLSNRFKDFLNNSMAQEQKPEKVEN